MKIIYVFSILLLSSLFGSCLFGTYIEKSYQFIGDNARTEFTDEYFIEDNNSSNLKWNIWFEWGEYNIYSTFIPYRTLTGPYEMRFFLSSNNMIREINIKDIALKYNDNELLLIKNIYEIRMWNDNYNTESPIKIKELDEFYRNSIIIIPNNTDIKKFDLLFKNIDVPYKDAEQLKLFLNIEIYYKNNKFEEIEKEYTLIRIKKKEKGSYH